MIGGRRARLPSNSSLSSLKRTRRKVWPPMRHSVAIALACVTLVGCTKTGPSVLVGGRHPWTIPHVLRIAEMSDPDRLNPYLSEMGVSYDLSSLVYSYLVIADDRGRLIGDLASTVPSLANGGISRDGRMWLFRALFLGGEDSLRTPRISRLVYARNESRVRTTAREGWGGGLSRERQPTKTRLKRFDSYTLPHKTLPPFTPFPYSLRRFPAHRPFAEPLGAFLQNCLRLGACGEPLTKGRQKSVMTEAARDHFLGRRVQGLPVTPQCKNEADWNRNILVRPG